jgi:Signal transduction histidine kinase
MRELSLHILDAVQNSLEAGASLITIRIDESPLQNRLAIEITDNGKGIEPDVLPKVTDPFYTTRSSRKVGLGLSLFQAAAERSGSDFAVASDPGRDTTVTAVFRYDDIDRAPLGNVADTLLTLVLGNPEVDFCYIHQFESRNFTFDTRELDPFISRSELNMPMMAVELREYLAAAIGNLVPKSASI